MSGPALSAHARRHPSKPVQPSRSRPHTKPSATEKASNELKAALATERRMALDADADAFFEFRTAEIERIAKKHHMKEDDVRKKLCNTTHFKSVRAPSLWNAVVHDRSLKAVEAGQCKDLYSLQKQEDDNFDPSMYTEEEKKDLIAQLVTHRSTQTRGARATNRAAAMDGRAVADQVSDALLDLFERTGIRALAIFTRGHPDDAAKPWGCDSGNALNFFEEELDISYVEVIRRYEAFSCRKDKGSQEANDIVTARKEAAALMSKTLRKAVGDKKLQMSYEDYDYKIRALKGYELVGWPEEIVFQCPATMSAKEARTIRNGLCHGAIFWHAMNADDRKELLAKHVGGKTRATRSDKGGAHKMRKKGKGKRPSTPSTDKSSSEEEDSDAEEEDTPRVPTTCPTPQTSATLASVAQPSPPPSPAGPRLHLPAAAAPHLPAVLDHAAAALHHPGASALHLPTAIAPSEADLPLRDIDWENYDYDSLELPDYGAVPITYGTDLLVGVGRVDYGADSNAAALVGAPPAFDPAALAFQWSGSSAPLPPVLISGSSFVNTSAGHYTPRADGVESRDSGAHTQPAVTAPGDFLGYNGGHTAPGFDHPVLNTTTSTTSSAVGVAAATAAGTATPVLAGTTNTPAMTKRKATDGGDVGSASKKHKGGDGAENGSAPKKARKVRKDKGAARAKESTNGSPDPEPRQRKVRSDKGKPRKPRAE
ncbi:hypothetical protein B0H15DRAFT_957358 [Mycena belliarum]|uniref:Uncharacterized protein n=1 Tax=Mycena belliarum TaxID=1033014 RepID=A0AAD6TNV5_9AGAR|nr:hypothetical protein B0H15DRAFT_957358 [Mycena belliae]